MPNWAEGTLKIRGREENILCFLKDGLLDIGHDEIATDENGVTYLTTAHEKIDYLETTLGLDIASKKGFYIKGTRRGFIDQSTIEFHPEENKIEQLEFVEFRQAWGADAKAYAKISKKYGIDIKIFTFEKGLQFTQEIEIIKGKIVKDTEEHYEDYFWDVPYSTIGG